MKKIFYPLLFMLLSFSACTEDDSTLATLDVSDIVIENLEEEYSVRSYVGVNLKDVIKPTVQTAYAADDLTYTWYLYKASAENIDYRDYLISTDKEPDYVVELPSGDYRIVLEVRAQSNDFAQYASVLLHTSTSYSQGFYILKETPDGNTDLDCYNDELMTDVIEVGTGAPMKGKPCNLSILYNGEYVDPESNELAMDNFVHVTTESRDYKGFRSEDLTEVFNRDNLFFSGPMDDNEIPYGYFMAYFCQCYISNTGIRSYGAAFSGEAESTGKLGYPYCAGGSKFVQIIGWTNGIMYWSNTEHRLMIADFNVSSSTVATDTSGEDIQSDYPTDLECLASGVNSTGGTNIGWFLCESPSKDERYLIQSNSLGNAIERIVTLDPSLHLAKSDIVAANGRTASYIYCVDGNKLYAYSLTQGTELEIPLTGIPTSETVTFVTNQYLGFLGMISATYNFDTFIVGTQEGYNYKLYFYEEEQMNGGQPIAAPGLTLEGTGKVKSVRYLSPQKDITGSNLGFEEMMGNTNTFPFSD